MTGLGPLRLAEPPSDPRQRLGRDGERAAEEALQQAGLRILHRRFRCRLGEIDLIARDGDVLVFAEVKARRGFGYGRPSDAVDRRKRSRLARVALAFLTRHRLLDVPCRFDVVEVIEDSRGELSVNHIPDAFRIWPTG
jgi:putative endonuclease